MPRTLSVLCACAALAVCYGCGGDNGSGPAPEVAVSLDPDAMDVEVGRSATITTQVTGTSNTGLTWFVNGIENGDDVFGTITHNSPATYTAPDTLPGQTTVEVRAISVADTAKYDSCWVTITFKVIHVDIASGDDAVGTGYAHEPVKTIHRGNELVPDGGTVLVAPGTYDTDHGETFTIYPGPGVTIEGENWETCIVRGGSPGGTAFYLGNTSAAVRKFTFESSPELGPDRWEHYVTMHGDNIRVDSLRTAQRSYYAPIRFKNCTDPIVENCVFDVPFLDPAPPGIGQNRGFEFLGGNTGIIIRGCTISGFRQGFHMGSDNDPLIENCIIEDNEYGVNLCCYQDEEHNANPDLGGGARGSAGGNFIRNNTVYGINNQTYNVIYAKYNTWTNDPPVAGEDYYNESTGGVIFQ